MSDPFARLGLPTTASADDVRAARRRLAKDHHPDAGGSAADMVAVNHAARDALAALDEPDPARGAVSPSGDESGVSYRHPRTETPERTQTPDWTGGLATDMPSFTVEALPAETFEALVVVAGWIGEVLDDDPPYRLDVALREPAACWCRLDVVPDAGSSTVSLTVGSIDEVRPPDVEQVRDTWIAHLNQLDWQ